MSRASRCCSQAEALKMAKGMQKVAQTKEQTKLIAQGIEKGIAEYKKQQKSKAWERDKQRKKDLRNAAGEAVEVPAPRPAPSSLRLVVVPWLLLAATWVYIALSYQP